MRYTYTTKKYDLQFEKPAKTSRNVFTTRTIYIIHLMDTVSGKIGEGEASPLSLLSIDDVSDYEEILKQKLDEFCEVGDVRDMDLFSYPSIRFGIETALLNIGADDAGRMFQTAFTQGKAQIPVNGLVWMNDADTMYHEALSKIEAGFNVIKFKVGALDFDEECRILEKIRSQFSAFKITLRLDANGGFHKDDALEQLKDLSRFEIHSIEQPIAVHQWDSMQQLCVESKIPIALDEELIGQDVSQNGAKLLNYINPAYLILKPNLIGGFAIADHWIELAEKHGVKWWATSALESNIGLNAIAQWVSTYDTEMHQGLGTGGLFTNNLNTNLKLDRGFMTYTV